MSITSLLRRAGAVLNPPPAYPVDPGPWPQLRDYPVARRPSGAPGRADPRR
jgi:hypothetical protein